MDNTLENKDMSEKRDLNKLGSLYRQACIAHNKFEGKCVELYEHLEPFIEPEIYAEGSVCYQDSDGFIFLQYERARVCRMEGIIKLFYENGKIKLNDNDLNTVSI